VTVGEYDEFQPTSDWGPGHRRHGIEEDLAGYKPGMGAMVSMGWEPPGYPSHTDLGYPNVGFTDEPEMGWEGWGGRARREAGHLRGMWRDRRGFWARLFNRPIAPVADVIAPPLAPGQPAPPPPAVAPPPDEMGFEWHEERPWGDQYAQGYGQQPDWHRWQGRGEYRRRW